jgi:hypothetical protein
VIPLPGTRHGSLRGLRRHKLDRTPVCDACLDLACYYEHQRAWANIKRRLAS